MRRHITADPRATRRRTYYVAALQTLSAFVCVLSCVVGCPRPTQTTLVAPNDARVVYLGAFDRRNPAEPRFAWPATEVRFSFQGTAVSVDLSDTPFEDETRETDWISVQLDGGRVSTVPLTEGKRRYVLAENLAAGEHTIRLRKRTEAEVGTITLHGFSLSPGAELRATARPSRRVLFVGDSITAGYGNEGPSELCHYSPATSDGTRTFASLAAAELHAEALLSAWSGKGVLQNYEARDIWTLPTVFMHSLPGDSGSTEIPRRPEPNAVVVALGTNDFFRSVPDEQGFLSAYRALLDRLSARAPHAPVLLVLSPMLADDHPRPNARTTLRRWLETLVNERTAQGHKVALLEQWGDPSEGLGCDFHPNLRAHERLARELSVALRELCRW